VVSGVLQKIGELFIGYLLRVLQNKKEIYNKPTVVMNYIYSFEKLEVWQKARELVKLIYQTTRKYPDDERFGLVSQMRRCSISIASNLAEGTARKTMKDKAHFSTMSYSSSLELLNQLILSLDLEFINQDEYREVRTLIEEVTNKLNSLRNSQLNQ